LARRGQVPRGAAEAVVAMLRGSDWAAACAADAITALALARDMDRIYPDLGLVETMVRRLAQVAPAAGGAGAEAAASACAAMAALARRRRRFRRECRRAGAGEALEAVLAAAPAAAVRESATAALAALGQTALEDYAAAVSSTGYFCLIVFCFFVQVLNGQNDAPVNSICGIGSQRREHRDIMGSLSLCLCFLEISRPAFFTLQDRLN
jgi:hypothetical protein